MNNEQRKWLVVAKQFGGGFISTFADCILRADEANFALLEPSLNLLMKKYPHFSYWPVLTRKGELNET